MSEGTSYEPSPLLARMLSTNGWDAEAAGAWVVLAGASVDGFPPVMTSLIQAPGNATAESEIPVLLPVERRALAAQVCAALNRHLSGGAVSISTIGRPAVTSKRNLSVDEDAAIRQYTALVLRNREIARSMMGLFKGVAEGGEAADILAAASCPPPSTTPRRAAQLPLADEPAPGAEHQATASANVEGHSWVTPQEVESLARLNALAVRLNARKLPICPGPLVLHADGVAECYGCDQPMERFHPSAAGGSCVSGRFFGAGHRCARCAANG